MLDQIWVWLIGLAGSIIKGFQLIIDFFKDRFGSVKEQVREKVESAIGSVPGASKAKANFKGTTLSLLRYSHDGITTTGLLYISNKFYCYTLEDAIAGTNGAKEFRVPAGTYRLQFRKEETALTQKYRDKFPAWFTYQIQLVNVPNFQSAYIHNGDDDTGTEGCILVSDSLSVGDPQTFFSNSQRTYKQLYKYLSELLNQGKAVQIVIHDEQNIAQLNA